MPFAIPHPVPVPTDAIVTPARRLFDYLVTAEGGHFRVYAAPHAASWDYPAAWRFDGLARVGQKHRSKVTS
jgi:hypothetical protein